MALYLISYDINEKDAFEYDGLWQTLRQIGAARILYSEWIMAADPGQASNIYSAVAMKVQAKDRLLVQEIARDATWDKLMIDDATFQKLLSQARG